MIIIDIECFIEKISNTLGILRVKVLNWIWNNMLMIDG